MKKILEIGGGRTPYFIRYRIPWNIDNNYICLDMNEKNLGYSKSAIQTHKEKGETIPLNPEFILADASVLDIPTGSVDEVIISNTLSAPIHYNWDRDGDVVKLKNESSVMERIILKDYNNDDPFYSERRNLIQEALRVLSPQGTLSIYTDLIIYGIHSYEKILDELKNSPELICLKDIKEASRVDEINKEKLTSKEFCCCFRAEVLPRSEVYRFIKI